MAEGAREQDTRWKRVKEWKELSDEERRSVRGQPHVAEWLPASLIPIAASQLNSNQWKSLIIPTACNAVELISVPAVYGHTMQNFKASVRRTCYQRTQEIKHGLMRRRVQYKPIKVKERKTHDRKLNVVMQRVNVLSLSLHFCCSTSGSQGQR